MAPMVANQSRTIIITPSKLSLLTGDENTAIVENAELPKYAVGLFESNGPGPRKRKRLTHLTPEEKIMRRKLKNRVAAQTARDRKKARLETLEETVNKIHEQTKKLLDVNAQLLERTEALERENQILRQRLGLDGDCSFTENQRQTLENIKEEFDEIVLPEDIGTQHAMKQESSDEDYCVLTPCDEASSGSEVRHDGSTCRLVKCGSPVPAAGSCQAREADPLVNEAQPIINTNYTTAEDVSDCGGEPDLSRILKEIAENFDAKKLPRNPDDNKDGDATGSSEIILVPGDVSRNKITVPLNVFGDHEYFKSEPCITLSQPGLTVQVPEIAASASQSSFPVSNDSKKTAALVEESSPAHVASQVTDDIQKTLSPFMDSEMEEPDSLGTALPDSLMDVSSLDDIFENLFTDSAGDRSSSDGESDSLSTASETASCPSPSSGSLETPSPIFDTVDPFELRNISSFWEDPFTADLFPQLAV